MEKDCPNCKFELYEDDKIPRKDCGMDDREYWQPKPQTNAQRIRAMSDEELAKLLAEVEYRRSGFGGGVKWKDAAHALIWLQQPAEEI